MLCLRDNMRIVLVSPLAAEREALQQLLLDDGHEVAAVAVRDEALDLAAEWRPDVVIADAQVAGFDGLAIVRALDARGLRPRVILLCPRVSRAMDDGRVVCLPKPIDLAELRRYLDREHIVASHVA